MFDRVGPGVQEPRGSLRAVDAPGAAQVPPLTATAAAPRAGRVPLDTAVLSTPVQRLAAAVADVVAAVPVELPGGQALADTGALLQLVEQLRGAVLTRIADVDARRLHELDDAPSSSTWVARQETSLDRGEVALARRLAGLPRLDEAVRAGTLSVATAERVGKALSKLRRYLDRPDGLIDGQDAEQVLAGVIGSGVPMLVGQALGGLADDDPRVLDLAARTAAILADPASQLARLEAAFVLLAQSVEPGQLPGALGQLVDAVLPLELERRAQAAYDRRGFSLRRNADGSGWHITEGELDLELGELLHTVLLAQQAVDTDNVLDTAAFARLREEGWQAGDDLPEQYAADGAVGCGGPRSLRQRRHDALKSALRTLLDSASLGVRGKAAPHIDATINLDALHDQPGALPAVAASGAVLPASLVRRWWCDSHVTRFVLGLGHRVLEASHSQRTLKAHERRIKRLETGGQCQGAGCHHGPGHRLVPHHPRPWHSCHETSLDETLWFCEQTHHDLHAGRRIRLKDGRILDERGWVDPHEG